MVEELPRSIHIEHLVKSINDKNTLIVRSLIRCIAVHYFMLVHHVVQWQHIGNRSFWADWHLPRDGIPSLPARDMGSVLKGSAIGLRARVPVQESQPVM